jgi:hypothetical protein
VYHADEDSDDEDAPRTKSLGQDKLDRRMKDTAEEVFYTLFGGKEQFQQYWITGTYRSGDNELDASSVSKNTSPTENSSDFSEDEVVFRGRWPSTAPLEFNKPEGPVSETSLGESCSLAPRTHSSVTLRTRTRSP